MRSTAQMLATAVLAVFLSGGKATSQEFKIFTKSNTIIHSEVDLTGRVRRKFREFTQRTKFAGAFYVGFGGTTYYYQRNVHHVDDAIKIAEARCIFHTKSRDDCELYSTIEAVGKSTTPYGDLSMSKELSDFVKQSLNAVDTETTGFVGVSASRIGAWAVSEIHEKRQPAQRWAAQTCMRNSASIKEEFSDEFLNLLKKTAGRDMFKCFNYVFEF